MDMQLFEEDLRKEVKQLPPELLNILKALSTQFGPQLEKLIMPMMDNLKRHIMTAMFESANGTLDKGDLEETIFRVLREVV